jgi:hypothetical protein
MRILIYFVALCSSWGLRSWDIVDMTTSAYQDIVYRCNSAYQSTINTINKYIEDPWLLLGAPPMDEGEVSVGEAKKIILFYKEFDTEKKVSKFIYKQYFYLREHGKIGLKDGSGKTILEPIYDGVKIMPYAFAVQIQGGWHLYDRQDLHELSQDVWDNIFPEIYANNQSSIGLIAVEKDALYGAIDSRGEIAIDPAYEVLEIFSIEQTWPLIRVMKNDKYGFLDLNGDVVITLEWQDAFIEITEDDETIVFVFDGEKWGGITKTQDSKPSKPNWDLQPNEETMAIIEEEYTEEE